MVLRDHDDSIIFTACRKLRACECALEVELEACREGLELAIHRTQVPLVVELDFSEAVAIIKATSCDRSRYMELVRTIQSMVTVKGRLCSA